VVREDAHLVASKECVRWDSSDVAEAVVKKLSLIADEIEQLVMTDRTTKCSAGIVIDELR
jgi:hypothetical protein